MPNPQVTINHTCYTVPLNGTAHRIRRDGAFSCGGTRMQPCAATRLIQEYLVNGGQRPQGHPESAWPEEWAAIPTQCPICDCPTLPGRHLDSRAGPGWKCKLGSYLHFWQVRMNPLRRYLAANPPHPRYPWPETCEQERQT